MPAAFQLLSTQTTTVKLLLEPLLCLQLANQMAVEVPEAGLSNARATLLLNNLGTPALIVQDFLTQQCRFQLHLVNACDSLVPQEVVVVAYTRAALDPPSRLHCCP
jgi:hypothetical protein